MILRRFLAGSLALLFLMTPSSASAQSVADLLAQIAALQAQIAAMTGGTSAGSCVELSRNLYFGLTDAQTGGEVSKLQRFLGGQVTGYFGPATEQLVQAWQKRNGIVSSGTPDTTGYGAVGPATRAAMARGCEPDDEDEDEDDGEEPTYPATSLGYSLVNKALDRGDYVVEGADLKYFVFRIDNSSALRQELTFPNEDCMYSYRIVNRSSGRTPYDSASTTACRSDDEDPVSFILGTGDSKSFEFSHKDSTKHLSPGSYRMWIDVHSENPLRAVASFDFGVAEGTTTGAASCAFTSDSTGRRDGIEWGGRSQTASSCRDLCVIVRNEKYGTSESGTCTYTDKYGSTSTTNVPAGDDALNYGPGVTAVGVYEGYYETPRGFQQHTEGTVNVNVTGESGDNRDLVLTSYESVNWILNVPSNVKIGKIIVTGYHPSRVTNAPSGTQVEYHSYMTDGQYYYAYQASGDAYNRLKSWLEDLYPAVDGELYGNFVFPGYSASSVDAYVGYKG